MQEWCKSFDAAVATEIQPVSQPPLSDAQLQGSMWQTVRSHFHNVTDGRLEKETEEGPGGLWENPVQI